jgi:hypothetical protein
MMRLLSCSLPSSFQFSFLAISAQDVVLYIESCLRLRHIQELQVQFDLLFSALPEDMVGHILDLVEAAPEANPYTLLRL